MQPFFQLLKKKRELRVDGMKGLGPFASYSLTEEELPIVEKLMTRDFKTAILHRHHDNKGIELLANDILTQRG